MGVNSRNVGMYGAVGVLVAALIIAGIAIAGVTIPSLRLPMSIPNKGTLILQLTDKPVNVTHINVTLNSVSVQRVEDDNETWVHLDFVGGVEKFSVDLLELENVTRDLSVEDIPPGSYHKIRIGVEEAKVFYVGGGWEDVRVPPRRIDVIVHFEIESGEVRIVVIDMWVAISESGNFRPVLKAEVKDIS